MINPRRQRHIYYKLAANMEPRSIEWHLTYWGQDKIGLNLEIHDIQSCLIGIVTIDPVQVKQTSRICVNISHCFIIIDNISTREHSTTNLCPYILRYDVYPMHLSGSICRLINHVDSGSWAFIGIQEVKIQTGLCFSIYRDDSGYGLDLWAEPIPRKIPDVA